MGIVTIARFLIGQQQAILDIAASRHAIWVGLLFVLSAGFAREYDGEDLLREPWHLLLPLAASVVTSTLLYALLWIVVRGWSIPNEAGTFSAFVSLYWMTAPLAWLYAIPVERFLPAAESVNANYFLLTIVAAWRVILIIRVASVLFLVPAGQLVFPVLLFSHTVLVVLTLVVPAPILAIMGGVRLSESDQVIAGMNLLILMTTHLVWPLLAIGALISIFAVAPRERALALATLPPSSVQRSSWLLAAASLAIWVLILPLTQPEQQRRWQAEQLLRGGRIGEGLDYMARHSEASFPPHWDPPPRLGYSNEQPQVLDVVEQVSQRPGLPAWITKEYLRKFDHHFEQYFTAHRFWAELSDRDWDRYLDILEKYPISVETIHWQLRSEVLEGGFPNRSPERVERFRRVMQTQHAKREAERASEPVTPPMPAELPQTPRAGALADEGTGGEKPAGRGADR